MKIDILKLLHAVNVGMAVVENIKAAKGAEKQAAVIAGVQEMLPEIEGLSGLDLVNDAALNAAIKAYIDAKVALENLIAAAKQLKPVSPPTP